MFKVSVKKVLGCMALGVCLALGQAVMMPATQAKACAVHVGIPMPSYPGYLLTTDLVNTYDKNVKTVQCFLSQLRVSSGDFGYNTGTVDGYYGNNTRVAICYYQSKHNLAIDEKVGNDWNSVKNHA